MAMYKRVLATLDGSPESAGVLSYAKSIAKASQAEVVLLRVVPTVAEFVREVTFASMADDMDTLQGPYQKSLPEWEQLHEGVKERAKVQLEAYASNLREAGVNVTTSVVEGYAAEAIAAEAEAAPDTLLAMATHGRAGVGRWMLGSVTDKVLRVASTPVLVIRPNRSGPTRPTALKRVILPLDGSTLAEQAIPHAIAMATVLGAELRAVRAVVPLAYVLPEMVEYRATERMQGAQEYVDWMSRRLREEGAQRVEASVAEGDAAALIGDAAGDRGDALIVMSTHGRSGVQRWLLGSVADRVVRHCHAPVLLVRAREMAG